MDNTTQKILNNITVGAAQGALAEKNEGLSILQQQVNYLQSSLASLQDELTQKNRIIEELEDNQVLELPFDQIAKTNAKFRKNYHKSLCNLAGWMLSQKAFKELSIEYGKRLGLTPAKVISEAKEMKVAVLDRRNNPAHTTNLTTFMRQFIDELKSEVSATSTFPNEFTSLVSEGRIYPISNEQIKEWYEAFELWLSLAEVGNREAQYNVGRCFHNGDGVDLDYDLAEVWYLKAFDQGEPRSAYNLSILYRENAFARKDEEKASHYFATALELKEARALHKQQEMLETAAKEKQAREEAELASKQKKEKFEKVSELYRQVSEFTAGAPIPNSTLELIAELDRTLARDLAWCYGLLITARTLNHVNVGSFFNPDKKADIEVSIEAGSPGTRLVCHLACFEDELKNEPKNWPLSTIETGRGKVVSRDRRPTGYTVSKICIHLISTDFSKKLPPVVIYFNKAVIA